MAQTQVNTELQGKIVTVLGGSGFIGRHLAQHLLARGARLRVVCRHPEQAIDLKPLGGLGYVQIVRADIALSESLVPIFEGSDAVVNLVGAFNGDLDAVQGKGLAHVANAAREAGVASFVHVSALGADAQSAIPYARTKAEGEQAVLAGFPTATVIRPAIVFGPDDQFVQRFARLIEKASVLPVFAPQAKFQPVLVDDLSDAICAVLSDDKTHAGKTYEAAGPQQLTMLEFNQNIAKAQNRQRLFLELPDFISSMIAGFGFLPGMPITKQQWNLLKEGSVASGTLPGLTELGIQARPLGLYLDRWMVAYRQFGRFNTKASV